MGKIIQVKKDFQAVSLPPFGLPFNAGQSTTVTDAEYAAMAQATLRAITVTNNSVADPGRSLVTPDSLQDMLTLVSGLFAAAAPDPAITPVWFDTSQIPPVLMGWNGTAWVSS